MELVRLLPVVLMLLSPLGSSSQEKVTLTVTSGKPIAETDGNFVCATLDWWPPEKCDFGQCPWGLSSILNLDLKNPILHNAVKAFGSLRIRLGGSLQDQVVYGVGSHAAGCRPQFRKTGHGLFGFSEGCLSMCRWDELHEFLNKTGAVVTFGLNALSGRRKASPVAGDDTLWVGRWDASNAEDFIAYTISRGHRVESWELGNELCGSGVAARVDPEQYGRDVVELRKLLGRLYRNSTAPAPKLLAPGGFFERQWFARFLRTSRPGVVDGVTHHIYNLGAGNDRRLVERIQDPAYQSRVSSTYRDVEATLRSSGTGGSAWVGESGGAFTSGGRRVSHTFVNGFWYLDQLGMTSTFDHKVFCRQSLVGGNYGLLNTTSFLPNPDYYGALLWHRLMGTAVLSASHRGSPFLRAYAHCSRQKPGVTLLLINMSNATSFDISVFNHVGGETSRPPANAQDGRPAEGEKGEREEYHLRPRDGDIHSDVVLLNGTPLRLTSSLAIPDLKPNVVDGSSPIHLAPQTIAFVRLKGFSARACL